MDGQQGLYAGRRLLFSHSASGLELDRIMDRNEIVDQDEHQLLDELDVEWVRLWKTVCGKQEEKQDV